MELKTLCCAGWILMFFFPVVFCCDQCLYKSKVAYYRSSEDVNVGACGYESFASTLYNGNVGAAGDEIYRDGKGCGGCFQMRCTDPAICRQSGIKVFVADFTSNYEADFVLSRRTFRKLAQRENSSQLLAKGIADIEYKRIPCEYPGQNMTVKISKISNKSNFLAVQFQYQGGQTDITSVDVAQAGSRNWKSMRHNYGAVWSVEDPPEGPLSLRLYVTSGYEDYRVWTKEAVLPSDWSVRSVYDTGVQINAIKEEDCSSCATQDWDRSE